MKIQWDESRVKELLPHLQGGEAYPDIWLFLYAFHLPGQAGYILSEQGKAADVVNRAFLEWIDANGRRRQYSHVLQVMSSGVEDSEKATKYAVAAWRSRRAACGIVANAPSHFTDEVDFADYAQLLFQCCVGNRLFSARDWIFMAQTSELTGNEPRRTIDSMNSTWDEDTKQYAEKYMALNLPGVTEATAIVLAQGVVNAEVQDYALTEKDLMPFVLLPTDRGYGMLWRTYVAGLLLSHASFDNHLEKFVWKDQTVNNPHLKAFNVATSAAEVAKVIASEKEAVKKAADDQKTLFARAVYVLGVSAAICLGISLVSYLGKSATVPPQENV